MRANWQPPWLQFQKMKRPVAIKPSSSSRFNYLFKFIGGLILSFLGYVIISNFRPKTIDIELILPPSGFILKSIAIPRVSGTQSNANIRKFIKSQFKTTFWDIEEDYHMIDSPLGKETPFTNLIITHKQRIPDGNRIILSAHYDSKLLEAESLEIIPEELKSDFIGATDSAWSCSLIIFIAKSLERSKNLKHNFQLIFFDGEEAVKGWSQSDSLYGSRALASKWSKLPSNHANSLKRIDSMILLDLLGSKDGTNFYSFHSENSEIDLEFKKLIEIEKKFYDSKFKKFFNESPKFKSFNGQAVEDDHTPFLPFGVPVLHLIPLPFPSVWHTKKDTIEALDLETCKKITKILLEYTKQKLIDQ